MSIYTKSKTTTSNLSVVDDFDYEDSFKVGIRSGAENIIIDYLTNLYANPATACVRELFTNASDASGDDTPVVIDIAYNADNTYTFTITDYGCGMSAKQLKENYVTYAASTKVDEFDSIGSFGLGSKSPMALVPSYEVTSNNGHEENTVTVSRTKNGIYAKISPCESVSERSFTKVCVPGIDFYTASRMSSFVSVKLVPFSKQPIMFSSCFDTETTYYEQVFIDNFAGYDFTMFTEEKQEALNLYRFKKYGADKFTVLARINNIVYTIQKSEDTNGAVIVVDIEPGYFAFAPSRETLPSGQKLEHIKKIISEARTDDAWLMDTYKDLDLADNLIEDFAKMCFYRKDTSSLKNMLSSNSIGEDETSLIQSLLDVIDEANDCQSETLPKGVEFNIFAKRGRAKVSDITSACGGFKWLTKHITLALSANAKKAHISNDGISYLGNDKSDFLITTNIVLNPKRNRNNEVVVPTNMRVNAARKTILDMIAPISYYRRDNITSYVVNIYIDNGAKLPEYAKKYLEYANIKREDNIVVISKANSFDYKDLVVESKANTQKKPVVGAEERFYTFHIYNNGQEIHPTGVLGIDVADKIEASIPVADIKDVYYCFDSMVQSAFALTFSEVMEKPIVVFDGYPLKLSLKYFDSIGMKYVDLSLDKSNGYVEENIPRNKKSHQFSANNFNNVFKPNDITIEFVNKIKEKYAEGNDDANIFMINNLNGGKKFLLTTIDDYITIDSSFCFEDAPEIAKIAAFNDIAKLDKDLLDGVTLYEKFFKPAKPILKCASQFNYKYSALNIKGSDFELIVKTIRHSYDLDAHLRSIKKDLKKSYIDSIIGDRFGVFGATTSKISSSDNLYNKYSSSAARRLFGDALDKTLANIKKSKEAVKVSEAKKILLPFGKYTTIYNLLCPNNELDMIVKNKIDEAIVEYNKAIAEIVK